MMYEYECQKCGRVTEAYRKVDDRNNCPPCESCTGGTVKIMSVPNVRPDIEHYIDPNIVPMHSNSKGTLVKGQKHKRQLLKEHGLEQSG